MSSVQAPRRPGPTRRATPDDDSARYASVGAAAVAVSVAVAPQRAPRPQPAPAARPGHLRVVAPTERSRPRLTPGRAVLFSALLFALLLAVAVSHTLLVQGQVKLDRLDRQLASEQLRYQQLRRDVAQLESPPRIVDAAHAQGMVTPDDLVYLQPPAPGASPAVDAVDAGEPAADASPAAPSDRAWAEVKPMLEAPAP